MSEEVFTPHRRGKPIATTRSIITRMLVAVVIYLAVYLLVDVCKGRAVTPERLLLLSMRGTSFVIDFTWILIAFGLAARAALRSAVRWWYFAEGLWEHLVHFWNVLPLSSTGVSARAAADSTPKHDSVLSGKSWRYLRAIYHLALSLVVYLVTYLLLTVPTTAIIWVATGSRFTSWGEALSEALFRNVMVLAVMLCVMVSPLASRPRGVSGRN